MLNNHEQLVNYQNSDSLFRNAFASFEQEDSIKLVNVDKWDGSKVLQYGDTTSLSLTVAIRDLATVLTQVIGIDLNQLKNRSMDPNTFAQWDRAVAFVIINIKNALQAPVAKSSDIVLNLIINHCNDEQNTYLEIVLSSAAGVTMSLLILLPFIHRAHTNISKVFNLFFGLQKEEFTELIGSAEAFLTETGKHFSAVIKYFNEIDFRDEDKNVKEAIADASKINKKKQNEEIQEKKERDRER